MLRVLGSPIEVQALTYAADGKSRGNFLEHFCRSSPRSIDVAEARIRRGQEEMRSLPPGSPRGAFQQRRQCFQIALEHEIRETKPSRRVWRIERIKTHAGACYLDGPFVLSREN